jgi:hypothetical protein
MAHQSSLVKTYLSFQGVMSGAIPWSLLEAQYLEDNFYKDEVGKFLTDPDEVNPSADICDQLCQ